MQQLNFEGQNKVEVAISLLQAWEPQEGYYLAFSGGKDSVAIYDLAVKAGVKFDAHYCVSPIDPKEIHDFIKLNYPDVIWDYHAKGFWQQVDRKGLPFRNHRWCCTVIKEAGGKNRVVVLGNRKAESPRRKQQCFVGQGRGNNKTKFYVQPIYDFDDYDIWQYLRENKLAHCSLYDEGYKRIGCVMCPYRANPIEEAIRFPKIAYLWRRACDHIVDARVSRNHMSKSGKPLKYQHKTGQELFDWWIKRK